MSATKKSKQSPVDPKNLIEINECGTKFKGYYDPDYRSKCEVCGQTPTVRIRYENGKVFHHTGMCGPCTWGEAETVNPDNW